MEAHTDTIKRGDVAGSANAPQKSKANIRGSRAQHMDSSPSAMPSSSAGLKPSRSQPRQRSAIMAADSHKIEGSTGGQVRPRSVIEVRGT